MTTPTGRPAVAGEDLERSSRVLFALTVRAMDGVGHVASLTGLRALLVLDDRGECNLRELATELALSQSATSRMVDRLVTGGLLDRRVPPDNRREVRLAATPAGRRVTKRLVALRRAAIAAIADRMQPTDVGQLREGLAAFSAA
ncbi:MAG TPA: MarR family transcriptional regulator, partial [Mycobacteriales bacterium]|nr:MarR family transcriptional regulator [Mycobacteriales bacterium]